MRADCKGLGPSAWKFLGRQAGTERKFGLKFGRTIAPLERAEKDLEPDCTGKK